MVKNMEQSKPNKLTNYTLDVNEYALVERRHDRAFNVQNRQTPAGALVEDITPAGCTSVKLLSQVVPMDYPMSLNQIQLNDDGTADCDECEQSKPAEGFVTGIISWGNWDTPAEYGQICKDCDQKRQAMEAEFNKVEQEIAEQEAQL